MIKRARTISTKLFLLTSLFLIVFLTVLMVVQSAFFESYYRNKKKNELQDALASFAASHYKQAGDENKLPELFPEFEKRYAATMAIGRMKDGFLVLGSPTRMRVIQVVDKDGNFIQRLPQLPSISVTDNGMKYVVNAMNFWHAKSDLVRRVLDLGETVSFVNSYADTELSTIAAVAPLKGEGGTEYVLLAASSLQPVGEAAGIVKDFYVYFLLLAVGLIVVLTYVYSRMISRPLVRLNEAAGRMAKLDFTARCDDGAQDEIGSLGKTLNFLSQNLNDTLGQLNAANEQLNSANEQLKADIENEKRLERLRREFVASVSHELKTPISLIGGYAEGLKDGIVQGERRDEYLDVIIEESERMASLVRDMLDLSQLESGKFTLSPQPFRIGALAESLTDKMFVELHKKRLVCEVGLEDPEAEVVGDEFRIGQVLTNLLANAIKHAPEGGKIRITTAEGPGEGVPGSNGTVWVEVYNDGDPIPDSDMNLIWDAFHTVDKSRNRELGGFGIGLAIVRNILTLHGSDFGVRNVQGGVLFYFSLPLASDG
ncbi:sensor histidine kinase [Paenibacillus flagellatus]|uniref:histidine kinase n=1 Tax=Paenibacillus flagellatus TaxID=2211139 RepID=A0A2V5KAK1_9BACL|nr:HAMP domain-containing sensor histidine kinase [Paenibacillus flagellatus]PYI55124.1 two-component sensor histidine kinase [Paenibacillus flagellatus]